MEERTEEGKPMGAEEAILLCESEYKSKGNCICKIDGNKAGTGFFCKIKRGEELIPVLITNYHVIDDNYMKQNNYLDIDENIFEDNSENYYENDSIYILHYANAEEAKVSFGKGIKKVDNYDIKHLCHTEPGSSGGPILSRMTNKVIGIHKGSIGRGKCDYNIGTFLKYPLNEVKNQNKPKENRPKVSKNNNYYLI